VFHDRATGGVGERMKHGIEAATFRGHGMDDSAW